MCVINCLLRAGSKFLFLSMQDFVFDDSIHRCVPSFRILLNEFIRTGRSCLFIFMMSRRSQLSLSRVQCSPTRRIFPWSRLQLLFLAVVGPIGRTYLYTDSNSASVGTISMLVERLFILSTWWSFVRVILYSTRIIFFSNCLLWSCPCLFTSPCIHFGYFCL